MTSSVVIAGTLAEQEYLAQRQKHPATAGTILHWCGRTPSNAYMCDEASGAAQDVIGTAHLTTTNTHTYQQATPYPNKVAFGFADAGTAFQYHSTEYDDDGTTSLAFLIHTRSNTINATRYWLGNSAGGNFYLLRGKSGGTVEWTMSDTILTKTATIAVDHSDTDSWLWASMDRTADLAWVQTRLGSASVDITGMGAAGSASTARFMGFGSVDCTVLQIIVFKGANAEGDPTETMRRIGRNIG